MKVKNVKKKWFNVPLIGILAISIAGCSLPDDLKNIAERKPTQEDNTEESDGKVSGGKGQMPDFLIGYTGLITEQTASFALDPGDKNFTEQLLAGSFYVVHDGLYYPAFIFASNYDLSDNLKDYVDPYINKQLYFTADNETEIPTLFLADGDSLVYYSTENVLDYIKWERFWDLGYTIGLYNIHQTEHSKLGYIDLEEDTGCIISGSNLETISSDIASECVSLIRIGNADITEDLVSDGLIYGTKPGESYDLEVYDGTNYHHYIAAADMHAFKACEMFVSTETAPLQQFAWKIEIPDYFVDGYYKINAICEDGRQQSGGMVRIVHDTGFLNTEDFFNEQLLYPFTEQQIADGEADEPTLLYQYSMCEELNMFTTMAVGALGFDDGTDKRTIEEKTGLLKAANMKTININFPKGEMCSVTIKPSKKESSGDAYVLFGSKVIALNYSALDNTYTASMKGDGNTYTLCVSGLWSSYGIRLSNCMQDNSGASQSVMTGTLTDDTYSLDGYTSRDSEKMNVTKELLDAMQPQDEPDADQEDTRGG